MSCASASPQGVYLGGRQVDAASLVIAISHDDEACLTNRSNKK
jgi:hypothetical protein